MLLHEQREIDFITKLNESSSHLFVCEILLLIAWTKCSWKKASTLLVKVDLYCVFYDFIKCTKMQKNSTFQLKQNLEIRLLAACSCTGIWICMQSVQPNVCFCWMNTGNLQSQRKLYGWVSSNVPTKGIDGTIKLRIVLEGRGWYCWGRNLPGH